MISYNVTINVNWEVHDEFILWLREVHFGEILRSGYFEKAQLWRLLDVEEENGPTYSAQYFAASEKQYRDYMDRLAPEMRKKAAEKWGQHIFTFRTVMCSVN